MLCRLQHPYMRPCTRTLNPKPCLLSGTGCTIHAMFAPSRFTELFEFATLTAPPFPGSPFCIFLLHALTSFRMLVVAVVLHNPESSLVLGAGPKSLRAAKSRSNPASPCGNVLPTHIIHHCDNILHPCLCSVTMGFRIFVLADRSIGNPASTWGMAGFDVLY